VVEHIGDREPVCGWAGGFTPPASASLNWLYLLVLAPAFIFGACTSETEPQGLAAASGYSGKNRPPVIQRATIGPSPVQLNKPVAVQVEAEDPDRNPITFRHQWFVNGKRVEGETKPTLAPHLLKRGDLVSVEVVASDGQVESGTLRSDTVMVGNTPPEVTNVTIESTRADRTQFHAVVEGLDRDGDNISYEFKWRKNETVVLEGESATLDTASFARSDSVTVEVTPYDAGGPGSPKLSQPIELGNRAPLITSQPPGNLEKGIFSYQVQATDEDKDDLQYELSVSPPGMTIDPKTGMISWAVGPEAKGIHRVRVTVQDGHGGSARQDFELSLSAQKISS